jgi:hypothetical protein
MTLNLRQSLGIGDGASVSATFADLSKISADSAYMTALTEILRRFPGHFHLFSGPGSVKGVRGRLHAEGVLPRVRFMGNMTDNEPLLVVCDFYLACFPDSDPIPGRASQAGKPSVILNSAAAGEPQSLQHEARTVADYIAAASRLIREMAHP